MKLKKKTVSPNLLRIILDKHNEMLAIYMQADVRWFFVKKKVAIWQLKKKVCQNGFSSFPSMTRVLAERANNLLPVKYSC